jgi:hypothetical protein
MCDQGLCATCLDHPSGLGHGLGMNGGNHLGTLRALLLTAAAGFGSFTGCGWLESSCEDAGREFPHGANWTCSDGCNSCVCQNGTVTSTLIGCPSPPGPAAGKLKCWDGNHWQTHGDQWSCNDDGCSECRCNDGTVVREARCSEGGEEG